MFHKILNPVSLLTRCIACNGHLLGDSDRQSFPLCSVCLGTLYPCPPLCPHCASPECVEESASLPPYYLNGPNPGEFFVCHRPWVRYESIRSFTSVYLLLNTGFPVLRKWKKSRGLLFDRQVLKSDSNLIQKLLEKDAQAIVPIPQTFHRKWKMRGSPAERIAHWLSSLIHLPIIPLLLPPAIFKGQKRQAEQNMMERFQNPIRIRINPDIKLNLGSSRGVELSIQRVILVDDFMTSGRTLAQASFVLKRVGIEEIHAFCLGSRVPFKNR